MPTLRGGTAANCIGETATAAVGRDLVAPALTTPDHPSPMMISCNVCGLDYDADDRDSCPRCDPDVSPRFHTTVRDDITKHVHLTIEHLGDEAFEEFQMALKTLIQEDFDGEVVVRD